MDRRLLLAEIAALSLLTMIVPSPASSADLPRSYIGTYEYDMGGKAARMSETLTVHDGDPQPFVSLTNTTGAVLTTPTKFGEDGEIQGDNSDPSVLCYNMATSALYSVSHASEAPASVYVRVGDASVAIPIQVTPAAAASDGSREYLASGEQTIAIHNGDGDNALPAQLVVRGKMRVVDNVLQNAVFSEATAVGNASNIVNQQTCTLNPGVALPAVKPGASESSV